MITFSLPGLWENYDVLIATLKIHQEHPEMFIDNLTFIPYGVFPYSIWSGGRPFNILNNQYYPSKEDIQQLCYIYNQIFKVPMRFIFTNNSLEKKDCYDRFNNLILEICNNPINEIVTTSPILEDYLQTKYPNYKLVSSTTKCIIDKNKVINELNNSKYYQVCLDYNLNQDKTFLFNLSNDLKNKIELLVNACCIKGCLQRLEHYKYISLQNLYYNKLNIKNPINCYNLTTSLLPSSSLNLIQPNELQEYINNNITHFKLEGRAKLKEEVAMQLAKYLIKPELQFGFLFMLRQEINKLDLYTF